MRLTALAGLLIAFAGCSGDVEDPKHLKKAPFTPAQTSPPNFDRLSREGFSRCDEGLAFVEKEKAALESDSLTDSQKSALRAGMKKNERSIVEGLKLLAQATKDNSVDYDVSKYQNALRTIRRKLAELPE